MLINSLLLFIEETLAVSVLYAYLCALQHYQVASLRSNRDSLSHHTCCASAILLGILLSLPFTYIRPYLGMAFNGIAYELVLITFTIVTVCSLLLSQCFTNIMLKRLFFSISLILLAIPHSSDFMVFFMSVTHTQSLNDMAAGLSAGMIAGISVGFGICISVGYLLFFLFSSVKSKLPLKVAIALFLASQLSGIVNILQQIDALSSSLPLWNSNKFIADNNEYGQFFNVLFGYDATPTFFYLTSLITFSLLILGFLIKVSPHSNQIHGVAE